jgi:hypothetical protein
VTHLAKVGVDSEVLKWIVLTKGNLYKVEMVLVGTSRLVPPASN